MKKVKAMNYLTLMGLSITMSFGMVKAQNKDQQKVQAEHSMIDMEEEKEATHTLHPDAQWYPDASLGLFIHWGVASVRASNISWPMIPGRALAKDKIDDPA